MEKTAVETGGFFCSVPEKSSRLFCEPAAATSDVKGLIARQMERTEISITSVLSARTAVTSSEVMAFLVFSVAL